MVRPNHRFPRSRRLAGTLSRIAGDDDGLREAPVGGLDQPPDVGGEQKVGGAVAAFLGQALHKAAVGKDRPDLDARARREGLEEGIDQRRLPVGIDIHRAVGACGGSEGCSEGKRGCGGENGAAGDRHEILFPRRSG